MEDKAEIWERLARIETKIDVLGKGLDWLVGQVREAEDINSLEVQDIRVSSSKPLEEMESIIDGVISKHKNFLLERRIRNRKNTAVFGGDIVG